MMFFLDTSALAKIYHRELGTGRMREIYADAARIQISELACLEFLSTVMRKRREGVMDDGVQRGLMEKFDADVRERYEVVLFTSAVIEEAMRILTASGREVPLRTLDAIQFAFYAIYCEKDSVFVSADRRLLAVAEREGRQTLNPSES